MLESK